MKPLTLLPFLCISSSLNGVVLRIHREYAIFKLRQVGAMYIKKQYLYLEDRRHLKTKTEGLPWWHSG